MRRLLSLVLKMCRRPELQPHTHLGAAAVKCLTYLNTSSRHVSWHREWLSEASSHCTAAMRSVKRGVWVSFRFEETQASPHKRLSSSSCLISLHRCIADVGITTFPFRQTRRSLMTAVRAKTAMSVLTLLRVRAQHGNLEGDSAAGPQPVTT